MAVILRQRRRRARQQLVGLFLRYTPVGPEAMLLYGRCQYKKFKDTIKNVFFFMRSLYKL